MITMTVIYLSTNYKKILRMLVELIRRGRLDEVS